MYGNAEALQSGVGKTYLYFSFSLPISVFHVEMDLYFVLANMLSHGEPPLLKSRTSLARQKCSYYMSRAQLSPVSSDGSLPHQSSARLAPLRPAQYFWTFSEVLEPLAIVPQLMVLQRYREVENLTGECST